MTIQASRILTLLLCACFTARGGQVLTVENLGGPALLTTTGNLGTDAAILNGILYFAGADSGYYGHGGELWRSDGTDAGTWMVKDFVPGTEGIGGSSFTTAGDRVFFLATNPAAGKELWITDGTADGTRMVRDLTPGSGSSTIEKLTALGSRLIFRMTTAVYGAELWTSDGTAPGTVMLKDIYTGAAGSSPDNFMVWGGAAYFIATTAAQGTELWKTDGTAAGTVIVRDIAPGSGSSAANSPGPGAVMGDHLYFAASDGTTGTATGTELWRTDGTGAGTIRVADIRAGTASSNPNSFAVSGGKLYFAAADDMGNEPWTSDGTAAGTRRIKDIFQGSSSSHPSDFGVAMGQVFFSARESLGFSSRLWKTDGTEAGTVPVQSNAATMIATFPRRLNAFANRLYFTASHSDHGEELWVTDGTEAGTVMVRDFDPGQPSGLSKGGLRLFKNWLIFVAKTPATGYELWRSDGTPGGTVIVKDIGLDSPDRTLIPYTGAVVGGRRLVFGALEDGTGLEPWGCDGTPGGTRLLRDINPGPDKSQPIEFTAVPGGVAYFQARDYYGSGDGALWRTDGTVAGTNVVRERDLDNRVTLRPSKLYLAGDSLFFDGQTASGKCWIHRLFLPSEGLALVLASRPTADYLDHYTAGNDLFATMSDRDYPYRLWKFDPEFQRLLPFFDAADTTIPANGGVRLRPGGDHYLFWASTPATGYELWRTSLTGAPGTTQMLRDIYPGTASSYDLSIQGQTGEIHGQPAGPWYYIADNGTHGRELWKTDGTPNGTQMVKDIYPGSTRSIGDLRSANVAFLGNRMFFGAENGTHGAELWVTDGSAAGTTMVKDIMPGAAGSGVNTVAAWGGLVFFNADDGINGEELWASDGTTAGTFMVADANPGPMGSRPTMLFPADDWIFFTAATAAKPREEVWRARFLPVPDFAQWAAAAGLTGADAGPLTNPSGDGVPNVLKYAFNLNPAVFDRRELSGGADAGLPRVVRSVAPNGLVQLTFTWLQRRSSGLVYTPLRSLDLQTWVIVNAPPSVVRVNDFWDRYTAVVSLAASQAARHYGAVRVSLGP